MDDALSEGIGRDQAVLIVDTGVLVAAADRTALRRLLTVGDQRTAA